MAAFAMIYFFDAYFNFFDARVDAYLIVFDASAFQTNS